MNGQILTNLLADIHVLNEQLAQFENKYGLLTDAFYEWYQAGNEPEDDAWVMDFSEWAGVYQSWQLLTAEYRKQLQQQLLANKHAIRQHMQAYRQTAVV